MWELYDGLIKEIPEDLTVVDYTAGPIWSAASTGESMGAAMPLGEISRAPAHPASFIGEPLKTMAECVKSWNFVEASLGMAAINAWYNSVANAKALDVIRGETSMERDAFLIYRQQVEGKKVAVVGHFPELENRFAPVCRLSILERLPKDGDYPDPACEYILPEQDYVFITGATLVNKTLPRLLTLSKNAKVVLVGPSVPLAPMLLDLGVYALETFVVEDVKPCMEAVRQTTGGSLFAYGKMVSLYSYKK
ncbi:MAG: DUF364 domain-containing protein [Anaerovorax sp.]